MMQQPGQQSMAPPQYQQQPLYMAQQPPQQMWGNNQPPSQQVPDQQHQSGQPGSNDEVRTLWIGDLPQWVDENYLLGCFSQTGEVAAVKIIRNKQTGQSEGYGFIEFISHAAAERILQTVNGTMMPHGEQVFRMNWASSGGSDKRDDTPEYTIFVGDLAADVTEFMLQETFRPLYPSVKGAKVVIDRLTGRTKGYGFVSFGDESEQQRAITEMNGAFCSTRPMRLGLASNKKTVPGQQQPAASYQNPQNQNDSDLSNTTIFVGNLDSNVTDDHLRELFGQYGQLLHVKIPVGKRCGFVRFADRSSAEEALRVLNGTQISGQSIRLSWGRSPSSKQAQPDANQWNSGYYGGYPQGYENYGYGNVPQNPNMYYGAYPGYGNYQQPPPQQQQQQPQQQMGYR